MSMEKLPAQPAPDHVDEEIGIGDIFKYSQLVGQVIAAFEQVHTLPVGGDANLPPFDSWLPDGHVYKVDIHVTKKR